MNFRWGGLGGAKPSPPELQVGEGSGGRLPPPRIQAPRPASEGPDSEGPVSEGPDSEGPDSEGLHF